MSAIEFNMECYYLCKLIGDKEEASKYFRLAFPHWKSINFPHWKSINK